MQNGAHFASILKSSAAILQLRNSGDVVPKIRCDAVVIHLIVASPNIMISFWSNYAQATRGDW